MKNNQENIWSNIKSRVQNHQPDEYTNSDWAAMDALLNAEEEKPLYLNGQFFKRLSIVLLIGIISFGLWSLDVSNTSLLVEQTNTVQTNNDANFCADNNSKNEASKAPFLSDNQLNKELKATETINSKNRNIQKKSVQNPPESTLDTDLNKTKKDAHSNNFEIEKDKEIISLNGEEEEEEVTNNIKPTQNRNLLIPSEITFLALKELESSPSFQFNEVDIYKGPNRLFFGKWHAGLVLGINSSITDYQNFRLSVVPHIGLFASKTLGQRLEFQVEAHLKTVVNYNETQTYEEEVFSSIGWVGNTQLTYQYKGFTSLDIPLTFKYALGNRFGILAGGRFSFLQSHEPAESLSFNGLYSGSSLQERVPKKGFWDKDIGLVIGAEYYLNTKWLLDVRYVQGLKDITPDNLYGNTKTHLNTDLQISIHRFF